ncbi:hypothetical protein [Dickeya dadantii]|uniref:hypothetical protein n=1 Tax=Dickeya dadantii TaxID=204038 RepID=UPI001FD3E96B|nr:hypothetical protein [Dickeya dadantii]
MENTPMWKVRQCGKRTTGKWPADHNVTAGYSGKQKTEKITIEYRNQLGIKVLEHEH